MTACTQASMDSTCWWLIIVPAWQAFTERLVMLEDAWPSPKDGVVLLSWSGCSQLCAGVRPQRKARDSNIPTITSPLCFWNSLVSWETWKLGENYSRTKKKKKTRGLLTSIGYPRPSPCQLECMLSQKQMGNISNTKDILKSIFTDGLFFEPAMNQVKALDVLFLLPTCEFWIKLSWYSGRSHLQRLCPRCRGPGFDSWSLPVSLNLFPVSSAAQLSINYKWPKKCCKGKTMLCLQDIRGLLLLQYSITC